MTLSAVGIKKAGDGRHGDGAGLELHKKGDGGKWIWRYSFSGKRREMGPEWQRLRDRVAERPLVSGPPAGSTLLRIAAGVALYGALLWAHRFLFGVSPLP